MFNTKQTYPNQALDNDLCQAVRAGNTIYVRGQIGTDFDGNLVGLGDPRAQAEQAMKNVNSCSKRPARTCRTSSRPPPT
jgi:enamine deaminase RidA (YjgF/YER057c/UK114 family)